MLLVLRDAEFGGKRAAIRDLLKVPDVRLLKD